MRILSSNNSNNFNESDSNISFWIFGYEAVVLWLKALIGLLQGLTLIILRIGSF